MTTGTSIAIFLALLLGASNAVPYSKYGRSCKDIGCRSDEVCVMAEDPCSLYQRDSCGRYPTCQRSGSAGESCTTKICPSGQYCKTENGRATCVTTTPGLAFDSAGITSVNGQRVSTDNSQPAAPADPSLGSRYASANPYGHANAPPADEVNGAHHNVPAYPPYPTSNNHNNNNAGYPPYPGSNNRPPVPVDQYGYPIYPPTQPRPDPNSRYPNTYPQHNLPQHNPGWGSSYPNTIYRRNAAAASNAAAILLVLGSVALSALGLGFVRL